jgi:serine/threonine protein kinase
MQVAFRRELFMSKPATTEAFLELGIRSGLLDRQRLLDFQGRRQANGESLDELSAALVREGLLTEFQAEKLLQGRWKGFVINGKYRLLERVGAGGMGCVYLAEHVLMQRRVALKVLPLAQARDAATVERFYFEARAAARLDHANIVRAHDVDRDGNLHFLVLEYVDGANLHEFIRRNGPQSAERAVNYLRQAALGLQHAHEAGLVHRDIKPSNLLLDRQGVVKLLDMGLARFFGEEQSPLMRAQEEGNVVGTADFLAPEQVDDSRVDIRADIYSLGCTFYYVLTGKGPFHHGSNSQKLIWHQVRRPRPIRDVRAEVPEDLQAVIDRMMAKHPEERFQTPLEIVEALSAWASVAAAPPAEAEIPLRSRHFEGGRMPGSNGLLTPVASSNGPKRDSTRWKIHSPTGTIRRVQHDRQPLPTAH